MKGLKNVEEENVNLLKESKEEENFNNQNR